MHDFVDFEDADLEVEAVMKNAEKLSKEAIDA